jgi:hypothetical protein
VQGKIEGELLQRFAGGLAAQRDLRGQPEVGQPGALADEEGDVVASRELLGHQQQASEVRVIDPVVPVVEEVPANSGSLEYLTRIHAEFPQDLGQVPDRADAC